MTLDLLKNTFGLEIEVESLHGIRGDDWDDDYDETMGAECRLLANRLCTALRIPRGSIPDYGSKSGKDWVVKDDCSCGLEVTSPALTWQSFHEVETVLSAMDKLGYDVSDACGLHVHHHLPALTPDQLRRVFLGWSLVEKSLFAIVDYSRNDNDYCHSIGSRLYDRTTGETSQQGMQRRVSELGRYVTLNATNWWALGLLEVRLHHGTMNVDEIKHWTMLTQLLLHGFSKDESLVDLPKDATFTTTTHAVLDPLLYFIELYAEPGEMREYLCEGVLARFKRYTAHKQVSVTGSYIPL